MGSRSALKKPDWKLWAQMPHTELWKAVALSCDIEPMSIVAEVQRADLEVFGGRVSLPPEYRRRRKIADAHAEPGGSLSLRERRPDDLPSSKVVLTEFRRFAESFQPPWSLPERFPRAAAQTIVGEAGSHERGLELETQVAEGTDPPQAGNQPRLSTEQQADVRRRLEAGEKVSALARTYRVSRRTIDKCKPMKQPSRDSAGQLSVLAWKEGGGKKPV